MTVIGGKTGPQTGFAEAIRNASWQLHEQAEQSAFMNSLLAGGLERSRYADLAAQQYCVYEVLEQAGDAMRYEPIATPFIRAELTRLPAIEADLRFLLGDDWTTRVSPTAATAAYCDRMSEVCFSWPGGFVAHHYVRYMGDLSGGQAIRKVVKRVYGLEGDAGTQFYVFGDIPNLTAFKDEYRRLLDDAPWGPIERQRIVDEILLAYDLNTRLLNEL